MMEKLKDILNKYRFAVLVALAGVVLMLLPAGKQEIEAADTAGEEMSFSLEETERRMAEVLSAMDGVGRVQVMLTLHSGETLSLAEDSSATLGSGGDVRQDSQVLTVNRGSGKQEVVADVPMTEIFGYSTDLRSMTGGSGTFSYEFARYEQSPGGCTPPIRGRWWSVRGQATAVCACGCWRRCLC